ncbi:MAG: metallophosphoesterase, partial [Prevotellaceae bacterium]|nr:metallophosphoesterase [Prevotellaceae bacterium]
MKQLIYILIFVRMAIPVFGQSVVTGYVFEDLNSNGKKDRKEKGIAQVAVSNGREVSVTDASGKYQLPVEGDNIIFVVKPAGYKTPLDEFNNSCSYYIHKPEGSPDSRYKGVQPTGKLPASVDFALNKY